MQYKYCMRFCFRTKLSLCFRDARFDADVYAAEELPVFVISKVPEELRFAKNRAWAIFHVPSEQCITGNFATKEGAVKYFNILSSRTNLNSLLLLDTDIQSIKNLLFHCLRETHIVWWKKNEAIGRLE
jgi:hypothetical protein